MAEVGTIRTLPAARRETTGLPRGYTGPFPKIPLIEIQKHSKDIARCIEFTRSKMSK